MAVATQNVSYGRQSDILDPERAAELHISILGMGTVGSWAAEQLTRAGFKKFFLCDMDVVEPHNLPSQAYDIGCLMMNKALAMADRLVGIGEDLEIKVQDYELMGGETFAPGVVISAVDSMTARDFIFNTSVKGNRDIELFIDFRMGGNFVKAYAFNPNDDKRVGQYLKTLEDVPAELPCGGRTFSPVGALAGALITQMVTKHLRDGDHPPYTLEIDFDEFDIVSLGKCKKDD